MVFAIKVMGAHYVGRSRSNLSARHAVKPDTRTFLVFVLHLFETLL